MSWLNAIFKKNKKRLGLQFEGNKLNYCLLTPSVSLPQISACGQIDIDPERPEDALSTLISEIKAGAAETSWVLPSEQYRIITVERPAVPESELKEAVRWQIKELIDYKVEDACLDYFAYPEALPGAKRLYVVVVHRQSIQSIVDLTLKLGLELKAIDIAELAKANLVAPLLSEAQNVAFLGENHRGLVAECFFGEEYSFARAMSGMFLPRDAQESEFVLDVDVSQDEVSDKLLLEIQRTLDYYESQISRQAVTRVILPDLGKSGESLKELLKDNLGITIETLELDTFCRWPESLSSVELSRYLAVIGCLLRPEKVADATH